VFIINRCNYNYQYKEDHKWSIQKSWKRFFDRFYRMNSVSVREACALGAQLLRRLALVALAVLD